jgi:hypothetical protein
MTTGRWFGPHVLDRHGRVGAEGQRAPRWPACLIVVFGPDLWSALIGTVLWGLGAAGFPVGMTAADDPRRPPRERGVHHRLRGIPRGPALVGAIGSHVGVLKALLVTASLLGCSVVLAGATRR